MSKNKSIQLPRMEGIYSKQAHANLPKNTFEREMGKEGFFGPSCHFYHQHPPTSWSSFKGELRPHLLDVQQILSETTSPMNAPTIFYNQNINVRFWTCKEKLNHLVRNADGDELFFVHHGDGDIFCDWGHLNYQSGDYILMPRGGLWRLEPSSDTSILLIESTSSSFKLPEKNLVGNHAIFDQGVLETPTINEQFIKQQDETETLILVKRHQRLSEIRYPFNPLDAVGWHGDLTPVKLNWRDIRPLTSHRYHLPPSAHTTFCADNFVVCTFVPRPFETDPGALKVPFFHNNDDIDEFIFYHKGNFFSRDNVKPGMATLHPSGFTHGPHPKALSSSNDPVKKMTDEVAIMIDTRFPVELSDIAKSVEISNYVDSWKVNK